jgi:phage terminase large subunit
MTLTPSQPTLRPLAPQMQITPDQQVLRDWMARYRFSAYRYVTEVLGDTPEPWQADVLREYDRQSNPDQYAIRISIASGHGVGKSRLLAWLISHHAITRYPQKTAVTAPSAPQLWDALWPELLSVIARLPVIEGRVKLADLFEIKAERIELREDKAGSFISAKTARQDQTEALQGVHSYYVLLVGDEASGIPDGVFDAAGGSMAGRRVAMILTGNPLRGQGYFYDTHHRLKDRWFTKKVSVFESKYSSPEFAADMEARYSKDSNQYRTRVMGEFPTTDDDVVIPHELIIAAIGRDVVAPKTAGVVWGLDVAFQGSNRTALAKRRATVLLEPPKAWGGLDDAQVAGRVKQEWDITPKDDRPTDINVDVIGYGAAVVTRLRDLGLPARGINVSESPSLKTSGYRNLRAELWFKGREFFAKRDCALPGFDPEHRMEDLVEELTTPTFKPQPISGKILIEEKKGRRSPDLADAFLLTLASESIALQGHDNYRNWNKPLSNPIKGLP